MSTMECFVIILISVSNYIWAWFMQESVDQPDQSPAVLTNSTPSFSHFRDKDELDRGQVQYLRQAFCGFVKAKQTVEMQHLGRVICAILGLQPHEQSAVMEGIARLSPAVAAATTFESLSSNLTSLWG